MELEDALRACGGILVGYEALAKRNVISFMRQSHPLVLRVVPEIKDRIRVQLKAIETNKAFFEGMVSSMLPQLDLKSIDMSQDDGGGTTSGLLTQLRREWSAEGALERTHCFDAALAALERHMPSASPAATTQGDGGGSDGAPHKRPRVLVPGAGLSRLNFELKLRGYEPLGVERACSFLLAADYMLRLLKSGQSFPICPHAHESGIGPTNVADGRADLGREMSVPDGDALSRASTSALGGEASLPDLFASSTIPGDFSSLTTQPAHRGQWDAVVSCFYIDASGDVVDAAEATRRALRPGGLWVCVGPLEYEGSNGGHRLEGAMRLCADELLLFVERRGFEILEKRFTPCDYTSDDNSMLRIGFNCLHFVARRVADTPEDLTEATATPQGE